MEHTIFEKQFKYLDTSYRQSEDGFGSHQPEKWFKRKSLKVVVVQKPAQNFNTNFYIDLVHWQISPTNKTSGY